MNERLVRVLPSAELVEETPGEPRIRRVRVDRTEVLLGRLAGGRVVAFSARCPHQQTDLEGATFFDGLVRCPLHVYLYDPTTGANVVPSRDADPDNLWKLKPGYLPVHPVEERDGWIWVGPSPRPPPPSYDPAKERPPPPGTRRRPQAPEPLGRPPEAAPAEARETIEASEALEALEVAVGAAFDLSLQTPPRPGFIWRVETGTPLLAVVEERFEPADPPRHFVRIAARGEGRFTVTCRYARPWDSSPAEVRVYEVRAYS